jgi:hypothetical protein
MPELLARLLCLHLVVLEEACSSLDLDHELQELDW